MKAAVIYEKGGQPQYVNYPDPVTQQDDELILTVKAAAIKHIDRGRVNGTHYSATEVIGPGTIIGGDGVGLLADGRRIYAINGEGMVAEYAVIDKNRIVLIPDALDDITAAALPNAVIGSAMALRFRANMQQGDTVLINGATGFTGKIAVQVAKHYGAKRIIATGRNEQTLQALQELGADEVIVLDKDYDALPDRLKSIHNNTPINVILDYLWGNTAEIILHALMGKGNFTPKTRFVSVGAVTGDSIRLSAEILRSADLQLSGSGLGSWTKSEVQQLFTHILPEMFQLAADGLLKADTEQINISDIASVWDKQLTDGKRLVVTI